jgi:hypothetical protein
MKSQRKRKQNPSQQVSEFFTIYAQAGGALEDEIVIKKKELSSLQEQLRAEKNAERREKLIQGIAMVQGQINSIQEKMKELLRKVAQKATSVATSLSSGIKSIGSKIQSSGIGQMIKSKMEDYRSNKVIKDYYSLKGKLIFQIQQLKSMKPKKDEICKKVSIQECNARVPLPKTSSLPAELFDEKIGEVPQLSYVSDLSSV